MRRAFVIFLSTALLSGLIALAGALEGAPPGAAPSVASDEARALQGLWNRYPPGQLGDPVRFYYFHDGGIGLYRYGRQGFTNTNSFDWRIDGDVILLRFRKTGAEHRVRFALEQNGAVLVLEEDPKEPGRGRYVKERGPVGAELSPFAAPAGGMWSWSETYATGGSGFSIYQLAPAALDGRGIGWHHRGDFDDWSTEALRYRMDRSRLELRFELTGEQHTTRYRLEGGDKGVLQLEQDPRNWWQRGSFQYMGESFEALWQQAAVRGAQARGGT